MSEMVATVARAIYEARNGAGAVPWSRRDGAHKAPYLADARAAIGAMREPTSFMVDEEGGEYVNLGRADEAAYQPRLIWRGMIDAALMDKDGGGR